MEATQCYSIAFQSFGGRGNTYARLGAARAWAMTGTLDSAYFYLFKIVEQSNTDNPEAEDNYKFFFKALDSDFYLQSLHADARWPALYDRAKANMPSMPELAKTLLEVLERDQGERSKIDAIAAQFGRNSVEMTGLWKIIQQKDSINLIIVTGILDKYGWLGKKAVGWTGNEALFLVVQHASLPVQEKYLPMMRAAVQAGNAEGSALALLEDRILVRNGKKQVYGSQVTQDKTTNDLYFYPIENVDQVDQRRATVGLGPLVEYAKHFGIVWNAEAMEKNKKLLPDPPQQK